MQLRTLLKYTIWDISLIFHVFWFLLDLRRSNQRHVKKYNKFFNTGQKHELCSLITPPVHFGVKIKKTLTFIRKTSRFEIVFFFFESFLTIKVTIKFPEVQKLQFYVLFVPNMFVLLPLFNIHVQNLQIINYNMQQVQLS